MKWNKWEIEENKKICYLDLDGVLNNYPKCWLNFLWENYPDRKFIREYINDLNKIKHQIPYQVYKDLKWEYRESGYKENIPADTNAEMLCAKLNSMGFHICIITSRPIKEHPSLFKQTVNWLNKNHIYYDDLIFDEDKHISVLKRYPHLNFGVEDHRYYANLVASWGYKMYLIDNKYNRGEIHPNVRRLCNLDDLADTVWENYIKE